MEALNQASKITVRMILLLSGESLSAVGPFRVGSGPVATGTFPGPVPDQLPHLFSHLGRLAAS